MCRIGLTNCPYCGSRNVTPQPQKLWEAVSVIFLLDSRCTSACTVITGQSFCTPRNAPKQRFMKVGMRVFHSSLLPDVSGMTFQSKQSFADQNPDRAMLFGMALCSFCRATCWNWLDPPFFRRAVLTLRISAIFDCPPRSRRRRRVRAFEEEQLGTVRDPAPSLASMFD